MKLSYYPGCSLRGTAHDYDGSVKAVCAELGSRAGGTGRLELLWGLIGSHDRA
mgnify:CR=1 FL=1